MAGAGKTRQVQMQKEKWEENHPDMEANLYEFLKQKRYLIVLDDIRNIETWDALKIGIDGVEGSRLIITSHAEDVGTNAGGESNLYKLPPLNDEESWELFSKIMKLPPENLDETIKYLTRAKRCGARDFKKMWWPTSCHCCNVWFIAAKREERRERTHMEECP